MELFIWIMGSCFLGAVGLPEVVFLGEPMQMYVY